MPYISNELRAKFDQVEATLELTTIGSPGELNYLLTLITNWYLCQEAPSYQKYNDVIGALECAKLELYRRKISDYEDLKIAENGDVP